MQRRSFPASRASTNGALRAVHAGDAHRDDERDQSDERDQRDERDSAGVEPFDDVHEASALDHLDVHGRNGQHGRTDRGRPGHPDADGGAHAPNETPHEPLGPDDPLAPLPFNPYKGNRGLTRAWHAMKNSLAGFRVAIREESAFRQELTLAAILLPCGVLVPVEPVSRVLLLGSVLLVLIVELLNSSVEAAIDRISLERHELSRRAKDLGSAAVMVALGMCLMTWGLIVGPLVVRWVNAWL
ncbi:diacylglycerol kinase [Burkholderia sp. WSM2230]|uniref:diacylglycerol kinase n=1 Tax=Burkholderia sp. WSM2230 TaxID=944435 RepID=UPI0004166B4C|nr:diacylglycerol kinase [Burkholderia sp. WSM2230]